MYNDVFVHKESVQFKAIIRGKLIKISYISLLELLELVDNGQINPIKYWGALPYYNIFGYSIYHNINFIKRNNQSNSELSSNEA